VRQRPRGIGLRNILAIPGDILQALLGVMEGSGVESQLHYGGRNLLGVLFRHIFQLVLHIRQVTVGSPPKRNTKIFSEQVSKVTSSCGKGNPVNVVLIEGLRVDLPDFPECGRRPI